MAWLLLASYLLLTPARSFSEKGLLSWLIARLGINRLSEDFPTDKIVHFCLFWGMVFLWHRVLVLLPLSATQRQKCIVLNVVGWVLVGIAIEFIQEAMQLGRQFDYTDMLANTVGCGLGGWVAKKLTPVETGVATKTNCL